ncbi:MAG TPA: hypothetical protein VJU86_01860 [Pyrinomonadaceae bacterium]|nr:hypothetical protein [Pyrinomonadaceae bacterium]
MATILERENVICEVDRIVVRDDGEATGGAEPYLWSIFFKIDGDSVSALIRIDNEGVSLSLDGEATVTSPDEGSHTNLDLDDDTVQAGGLFEPSSSIVTVPRAVGRFTTELVPIPATIEIDPDSWVAEAINNAVVSVQGIIDSLSGDGCPQSTEDSSQLVGEFATKFLTDVVGGIPGAFGALYTLMEEDWGTDEETAEDARRALRDAFTEELANTVIPSISLRNQEVSEATMEEIETRVADAVTQAVVEGINLWWLILGIAGLLIALDQDDPLGSAVPTMSHFAIAIGEEQEIDERLRTKDNGDWSLRGRIGRDS